LTTSALTAAIETAAVLVSALAGMISAARKRMDIVGTYCLATITAFGGGTLRDLLIDRRPFFWVQHASYIWVIGVLCVAFVYSRSFNARVSRWHGQAVAIDAMGLALFTLSGVGFALGSGMPMLIASLIGVITGTFGGLLRDVVSTEIPVIFQPGSLYALCSFAGAWVFLGGMWLGLAHQIAGALAFVTIVALRLVSVRFGVRVPDPLWLHEPRSPSSPPPTRPDEPRKP
jgi:uncharacterized membrane protein YeiH